MNRIKKFWNDNSEVINTAMGAAGVVAGLFLLKGKMDLTDSQIRCNNANADYIYFLLKNNA